MVVGIIVFVLIFGGLLGLAIYFTVRDHNRKKRAADLTKRSLERLDRIEREEAEERRRMEQEKSEDK